MRFEEKKTCIECMKHTASCGGNDICNPARDNLRRYQGIRFTSDGFDCAFPVCIDSHTVCSFGCLYCFAPNTLQGRERTKLTIGQTSLREVERIFSGKSKSKAINSYRKALKYDNLNKNGYPCAVQLGALTDPFDNIERQQGWFLKFAEIVKKYNQPVKISTKGNLFLEQEYLDAIADRPELFFVTYSIITPDDKMIKKIEPRAPNATERIQCIQNLTNIGVKVGLRMRPILPGVSDSTPDYPEAYKTLIQRCVKAGIQAISYEVAFTPGRMTPDLKRRWKQIEKETKIPIINLYKNMGSNQACMRPSHKWTEQIMYAIRDEARKHNLTIGVSDPAWKQLTEVGCCCGITEDDPVFGNWQKESASNQLLIAKNTGKILTAKDITPEWAYTQDIQGIVNTGPGPKSKWDRTHIMWADKLNLTWNDISKERSPLQYFQGALIPIKRDKDGELSYKYIGLKPKHPKNTKWWNIKQKEGGNKDVKTNKTNASTPRIIS
jgi:DNA repair photolyase